MKMNNSEKRRVLVESAVEESEAWRDHLEKEFDLVFEPDAEKAVLSLDSQLPDVILLNDACEGNLDGLRALNSIRIRSAQVPVIFLTGTGYSNESDLAIRSGAASDVLKPCRGTDLSDKIHEAVDKKTAHRILPVDKMSWNLGKHY